ncbi:ABC transporter substrate-binding protein [Paenibacillus bovis]|uniref:ABC transporter substrate-binding protein n=1 Tax=Paenibacillus bovis TaxID=1616788 RepID=A0A172ZCH2_9BACL|nr:ABC transporter substrate-binding protein [Paenibacillus bovis]ANF94860.1 ABC transporter substrate-binding protein [Paenibacillus bovis]
MKLHRQFLLLHSQYGGQNEQDVTLDELAEVLECTHRNALNIITRMSEQGWIGWQSQRGRGRRSQLTFIASPEQIAMESMMHTIERRDIRDSMEQIRLHARSPVVEEQLQDWLLSYFGPHSEIQRDRQIDQLRLPIRQRIHTVDPLYMNLLAESFVSSHIFDGLVRKSGADGTIIPHLAHAWETDAQRTGWTFYLRKDVLFHHGQILTAEDVVYTFERLIRTSRRALYRFVFKQIQSVRALNATTVHIQLQEPSELFLPFLCTSRAAIVPKGLNRRSEQEFGLKPSGTGPFRMVEQSEERCVLEVFKPYFQGRAHLDRVEIIHIPWSVSGNRAEPAEPISPFHLIPNPAVPDDHSWSQLPSPVSVRKFVTFNTQKEGPLRDPHIRAHICNCLQDPTNQHVKPAATINTDNIVSLRILTIPQYRKDAREIAETLQQHYDCEVLSLPIEQFQGPLRMKSDLIVFSLTRDQDEQLRLYDLYLTLSQHMDTHTRIDIEHALIDIRRQSDARVRDTLFRQIWERLAADHQLYVLYEKPVQTAYLPTVRGITFNSQGWVDLRHIWFPSPPTDAS